MSSMSKLSIQYESSDKELFLHGPLDETAFQSLSNAAPEFGIVNLAKLTRVSSLGADAWIRWLQQHPMAKSEVQVRAIAPCFVRTLNSIESMLPATWRIESFYVPYLGKDNEITENVLFQKEKNFTAKEINLSPVVSSPVDGQKLEIDVDPGIYFRFLRSRFPGIKLNDFS